MMLADARALAKRLQENHNRASVFFDVKRIHNGFSMMVYTTVAPETIGRWLAAEEMMVTRVEARGEGTWRVWFQESKAIQE